MDPIPLTGDDYFLSGLSPKDLNSFARTSTTSLERVLGFKRRAFNIENLLKKYFTSQEFFELVEYPESDLDLYVEHLHKQGIIDWLVQIGYTQQLNIVTPPLDNYVNERGIAGVFNFRKLNPERKIQLITSNSSPVEIVLSFHPTCVMNVITHEKAYSIYPKGTLEEHRSLMYSTEGINQEAARNKYISRGWTMVGRLTDEEIKDPRSAFRPGVRHIGDKRCLTIELHPKLNLPESLIEINSWAFRIHGPDLDQRRMPMIRFSHEKLRFRYILTYSDKGFPSDVTKTLGETESEGVMDSEILDLLRHKHLVRILSGSLRP